MLSRSVSRSHAETLAPAFLQARECVLRGETMATYGKKLRAFLEWWGDSAADEALSANLATRYHRFLKHQLSARRISKRSLGLYLSVMRQWGRWLEAQGEVAANPFADCRGPGRAKGLTRSYLSLPEIHRLLQSFDRSDRFQLRDLAICYLMLKTAVWPSELARANIGDLERVGERTILYVHHKGSDDRTEWVEVLPEVMARLQAYLDTREEVNPKQPLFAACDGRGEGRLTAKEIRWRIYLAFKRAKLKRSTVSSISLRQTPAMHALRNRAPLPAVQRLLRHQSIHTTEVYQEQLQHVRRGAERYLKY